MPEESLSPSARMSAAFSKLRESAKEIKATSDELTRAVRGVERALDHLDLRVASWTLVSEWKSIDQDEFFREYVGYIELHRQWQIAVRTSTGFDSRPDESQDVTWGFEEAPQYLRIKAVDKLPDLIESLVLTVDKTTERMKKRIVPAHELERAVASRSVNTPPVSPWVGTPPPGSRPVRTSLVGTPPVTPLPDRKK